MDRQLITRLFIPLILLTILILVINKYYEFQGLFINLATELIGIIITVIYVDYIIKKRETEKWKNVDKKVSAALRTFINATISTVRTSFGYGFDIIDYRVQQEVEHNPKNINLMFKELIRISREILEPTTLAKVSIFDQKNWKAFIEQIQYLYDSDVKLLSIYGSKLTPTQYELLMEIQDLLTRITIPYH